MYTAKHIQFSEKHAEALPAYYRLQQTIMDKLVNGEWQAGKQLPSERQFAQTTGFSVGTVRKALENMVHQGTSSVFREKELMSPRVLSTRMPSNIIGCGGIFPSRMSR